MMTIAVVIIIILNIIFSYRGFRDHSFFEKYSFSVDKVLVRKDYKVLVTSGFLHINWVHLILNMLTLYFFSNAIELYLGTAKYLLIYFSSLLGGNLFSLFIHRHHGDYAAVGASGAVSGIIFASIAIFPGIGVSLFLLPIFIPGWLYGILYVLYSVYGIKSRSDNIGHDAHLAGALTGLAVTILLFPEAIIYNYLTIIAIVLPSVILLFIILKNPAFLLIDNYYFKTHRVYNIEDRYNIERNNTQREIDRILEKIHRKGMNSLTEKEKQLLREHSKR